MFVTEDDHGTPCGAELEADDPAIARGARAGPAQWRRELELPVPWGNASGPCGEQSKSAFSCLPSSTDLIDRFQAMQGCMQKYPDLYPQEEEGEEEQQQQQPEHVGEATSTEAPASEDAEGSRS
ncbi:Mitochondrial intermembrane space import and assembly protein 40 [Tupaia chinensis]|uniref:Mitochondrial intermembrane space import and assembly protein 40 n=1 Tax=Tupaia chinensis TaxID=246437 RepID=L9JFG2_TUPCH|nr:Mitochondrial intermembrane space import and assembly protein 40 [Tupaia chinensis]